MSYGITWVNPNKVSFSTTKTIYIISSFVDLDEKSISIPADSVLLFLGGCLNNGTIVGNKTRLIYSPKILGSSLTISGTWEVDYICSDMLQKPAEINALKKLNSLMSDDCYNKVVVLNGNYYFEPSSDGDALFFVKSKSIFR